MTGDRERASPRPGFLSGFLPSLSRALRTSLPGKRMLVLVVVLSIPPLLALAASSQSEMRQAHALASIVFYLYLQFLIPICGLLFGAGVLMQEMSAGNLPYLCTRPVPRSSILLGRYVALVGVGCLAVGLSLSITLVLLRGASVPRNFAARALAATLLAVPTYVALFAALSILTRRALVIGFLYTFGVEGFLGFIPGTLRRGTLLFYTRALTGTRSRSSSTIEKFIDFILGAEPPPSDATCVLTLLSIAAVAVAAMCFFISKREFAQRDVGTV